MGDDPAIVLAVYGHLTVKDDDRIRGVMGGLWNPGDSLVTPSTPARRVPELGFV